MTNLNILVTALNAAIKEVFEEYKITEKFGREPIEFSAESLEIIVKEYGVEGDEDLVLYIASILEMSDEEKNSFLDKDLENDEEACYRLKNSKCLVVFDEYCWKDFEVEYEKSFEDIVWEKVREKLNS